MIVLGPETPPVLPGWGMEWVKILTGSPLKLSALSLQADSQEKFIPWPVRICKPVEPPFPFPVHLVGKAGTQTPSIPFPVTW